MSRGRLNSGASLRNLGQRGRELWGSRAYQSAQQPDALYPPPSPPTSQALAAETLNHIALARAAPCSTGGPWGSSQLAIMC